ncbi:hypothetical protein HK405_011119 [Cladochytrium tenue]|nr:hypothetical protein HK405_011119 [Cladochytrium tenue]
MDRLLPREMLARVAAWLENDRDLTRLARASRALRGAAQPLLVRRELARAAEDLRPFLVAAETAASGTTAEGSLLLATAERVCRLCLAPEAFDVVAAAMDAISGTASDSGDGDGDGGNAEATAAARAAAVDAVAEVVQRGRAAASRVLARMHAEFALGAEDLEYIAARREATVVVVEKR